MESLANFLCPSVKIAIETTHKNTIHQEFKLGSRLFLTLDRTQWKENNVLMIVSSFHLFCHPLEIFNADLYLHSN